MSSLSLLVSDSPVGIEFILWVQTATSASRLFHFLSASAAFRLGVGHGQHTASYIDLLSDYDLHLNIATYTISEYGIEGLN